MDIITIQVKTIQGITLESAVIDLGPDIFAKGQAYVAISRVRSLDRLFISNLTSATIVETPSRNKKSANPGPACQYALAEMTRLARME